jgi:hypothetical protein
MEEVVHRRATIAVFGNISGVFVKISREHLLKLGEIAG